MFTYFTPALVFIFSQHAVGQTDAQKYCENFSMERFLKEASSNQVTEAFQGEVVNVKTPKSKSNEKLHQVELKVRVHNRLGIGSAKFGGPEEVTLAINDWTKPPKPYAKGSRFIFLVQHPSSFWPEPDGPVAVADLCRLLTWESAPVVEAAMNFQAKSSAKLDQEEASLLSLVERRKFGEALDKMEVMSKASLEEQKAMRNPLSSILFALSEDRSANDRKITAPLYIRALKLSIETSRFDHLSRRRLIEIYVRNNDSQAAIGAMRDLCASLKVAPRNGSRAQMLEALKSDRVLNRVVREANIVCD